MRSPSIPPQIAKSFPKDEFEAWLAKQALLGHDRLWLNRNRIGLKQRWRDKPTEDLPEPIHPDTGTVPDRYKEL